MKINLEKSPSYEELYETIKSGRGDLSFFGSRYVYISNNADLLLDDITNYVIARLRTHPNFDETERSFAKKLVIRIDELYLESEKVAMGKNVFIRLFFAISEFWIKNIRDCGYGVRFHWEEEKDFPNLYTKIQYENTFSFPITRLADDYRSGLPQRWMPRMAQVHTHL